MVWVNVCSSGNPASLSTLPVDGHFVFDDIHHAAKDSGNMFQFLPSAVLYPKSVSDILMTIKHAWQLGPHSKLKIAARGRSHFLQGQSQAHQGVVIKMESIQGSRMKVHIGRDPYVDVSGGELWINILRETLFYNTLGRLGQFGIITRAGISLEQAPTMASASNGNHCLYFLPTSQLKIAARGRGHSLQGQLQAHQGVVIKMESIQGSRIKVHIGRDPYMNVSGGEL